MTRQEYNVKCYKCNNYGHIASDYELLNHSMKTSTPNIHKGNLRKIWKERPIEENEIKCRTSICSNIGCSSNISNNHTKPLVWKKDNESIKKLKRPRIFTLDNKIKIPCDEEDLEVCTQNKDDSFNYDNEENPSCEENSESAFMLF